MILPNYKLLQYSLLTTVLVALAKLVASLAGTLASSYCTVPGTVYRRIRRSHVNIHLHIMYTIITRALLLLIDAICIHWHVRSCQPVPLSTTMEPHR